MTVGRDRLAPINRAPCISYVHCPPIAPGETRAISYPSSEIGPEEREAVVHSWHVVPDPADADRPDSVRTLIVRL